MVTAWLAVLAAVRCCVDLQVSGVYVSMLHAGCGRTWQWQSSTASTQWRGGVCCLWLVLLHRRQASQTCQTLTSLSKSVNVNTVYRMIFRSRIWTPASNDPSYSLFRSSWNWLIEMYLTIKALSLRAYWLTLHGLSVFKMACILTMPVYCRYSLVLKWRASSPYRWPAAMLAHTSCLRVCRPSLSAASGNNVQVVYVVVDVGGGGLLFS